MRYSKEERAMWLEDWKQSGKSASAYARENGLVPWTFNKWTKDEKETGAKKDFVEIRPKTKTKTQAATILIEKGDVRIHIPLGISKIELNTVIESLWAAL